MILKLSLVITLLFGTINGGVIEEKNSEFNLEDVWRSSDDPCSCKCKPDWVDKLQKTHKDGKELLDTFPHGSLSDQADALMASFESFLTKAATLVNSKSTILSSGSNEILIALTEIKVADKTAIGGLIEFNRVLSILTKGFKKTISNLKETIGGDLTCIVNDAMSDLECSLTEYMDKFLQKNASDSYEEVDSKPFMQQAQKFANTISLIGETALNNCKLSKPAVQDSLVVLSLILNYLMIGVTSTSSCSEAVLAQQKCDVTVVLHVCSVTVGYFVNSFTKSIVKFDPSNENSFKPLIKSLVALTVNLNSIFETLFGAIEDVGITVGLIIQSLSKSVFGTVGGTLNKFTNTLRGVAPGK